MLAPNEIHRPDIEARLKESFPPQAVARLRSWGLWDTCFAETVADLATSGMEIESSTETEIRNVAAGLIPANLPQETREFLLAGETARRVRAEKLRRFKRLSWESHLPQLFLKYRPYLERVIYSLIRVKDLGLAKEIYCRIQEGEQSFADAAREFSEGSDAMTGGLLGPVPLSSPHPELAKLLEAAQPGQLLPPRRVVDWFLVVRLEKRLPAQLDGPTEAWLLDRAHDEWLQAMRREALSAPLT